MKASSHVEGAGLTLSLLASARRIDFTLASLPVFNLELICLSKIG